MPSFDVTFFSAPCSLAVTFRINDCCECRYREACGNSEVGTMDWSAFCACSAHLEIRACLRMASLVNLGYLHAFNLHHVYPKEGDLLDNTPVT